MAKSVRSLSYKIRNNKLKLSKRFRKKRGGSRKLIRRKKVSKNKKLKRRRRRKSKYIGGSEKCGINFNTEKSTFEINDNCDAEKKQLYEKINEMIGEKKIIRYSDSECNEEGLNHDNTIIFIHLLFKNRLQYFRF